LNINEGNNYKNTRKYSDDNTIASENPFSTRDYHQASSSSANETKYKSTVSNSNNYDREQYHSRESSPSAIVNRNQSPLPASSHISSSTTRTYQAEVSRDSTSPSSTYVPQRDTYNVIFLVYKIVYILKFFRLNYPQILIQVVDVHHHLKIMVEHLLV
jgi:hypothetical protein